jgi:hypothetical protein
MTMTNWPGCAAFANSGWWISSRKVTSEKSSRATIPYPELLAVPRIVDARVSGAPSNSFRRAESSLAIYRLSGDSDLI